MEPGSALTLVLDGTEDTKCLMALSVTELISILRTAYRTVDYDIVEEVLVAKETKLKDENGALKEKLEMERLERMNVEEELKKCKEQCEKRKKAEERYERLLEAVKKRNDLDDGNTVIELRIKNRKLEDEKRRAESEVESWKRICEELNERLLMVEKCVKSFSNGDTRVRIGGNAEELSGVLRNTDPGVSTEVIGEKEMNEAVMNGRECENTTAYSPPSERKILEFGNTHLSVDESTWQSPDTPNKAVLVASGYQMVPKRVKMTIGVSSSAPTQTYNKDIFVSDIAEAKRFIQFKSMDNPAASNARGEDTSNPNIVELITIGSSNEDSSKQLAATPSTRGKSDPAWEHFAFKKEGNTNVYTCLFCSSVYRGGGINRMKRHLAGVPGQITICKKVPPDVRCKMQEHLKKIELKKKLDDHGDT